MKLVDKVRKLEYNLNLSNVIYKALAKLGIASGLVPEDRQFESDMPYCDMLLSVNWQDTKLVPWL